MGDAIRSERRSFAQFAGFGLTSVVQVETQFDAHGAVVEQRVRVKEGPGGRWSAPWPSTGAVERQVFERAEA